MNLVFLQHSTHQVFFVNGECDLGGEEGEHKLQNHRWIIHGNDFTPKYYVKTTNYAVKVRGSSTQ